MFLFHLYEAIALGLRELDLSVALALQYMRYFLGGFVVCFGNLKLFMHIS